MEDLDAATVDDVKEFFRIYYAPNNAVLALAGDLDTQQTLAKVKKYFGSIPRQEAPKPTDLSETPKTAERRATLDDPLARLVRLDIAYRIPPSNTADARALQAAAQILGGGGFGSGGGRGGGGGNSSRLYQKLVTEKELATQVSASTDRRAGPGTFHISATLRPGVKPEEVEGLIGEEIARLYSEPVSGKELARFQMNVRRAAESRVTVLSRAQALADAAAVFDDPEKVNADLDAQLKIQPADIQRAAKASLVRANSVVVVTQPAGGAAPGGRRGGR
jgi:predicted Zn-dependent peptidase